MISNMLIFFLYVSLTFLASLLGLFNGVKNIFISYYPAALKLLTAVRLLIPAHLGAHAIELPWKEAV